MPSEKSFLAGIAVLMFTVSVAVAQSAAQPAGVPLAAPDPQIVAGLQEVSPERIQQTIEKLVSFYTRQTLSSVMPAASGKGANAASEWIKSEFEQYSKSCGGCLEVK